MEFTLHTYDIQNLIIALCCAKTDSVLTEEVKERLSDKLCELNRMCNEDNDYTLSVSVNEDRPRIIVEVEGGNVQGVYSSAKVDVDVLDYDNYMIAEEDDAERYEDLICEKSLLGRVW